MVSSASVIFLSFDPVPAIERLLKRSQKIHLMHMFRLAMFKDHEDFLKMVAVKRSMMRKGGEPNVLRAARTIFESFSGESIALCCLPPQTCRESFEMPEWYKRMDTAKLLKQEQTLLLNVPTTPSAAKRLELSTAHIYNPDGDTTEYDVAVGDMSAYIDASDAESNA